MSTLSVTTIRDVQNFESTVVGTVFLTANAAFGRANTALQNTTGTFAGTLSVTNDLLLGGNTVSPFANAGREIVDIFGTTDSIVALRNPSGNSYLQRFSTECYLNNQTGNTFLTTGQSIVFQAGGNERMRIDSSGRVTKPNQPAFYVGLSTATTYTNQQIFVFNLAILNRGSHYNTSNGRFTAPVAGVYHFSFFGLTNNDTTQLDYRLWVNGADSNNYGGYAGNWSGHKQAKSTWIVNLNAGDYVEVRALNNAYVFALPHSAFSGFLIG